MFCCCFFHKGTVYSIVGKPSAALQPLNRLIQISTNRRMAENGFAHPHPLGIFADTSYLVEN